MPNDSSKVAVVGTGYWGKNLVRNFAELGVLAGICDASASAIDAMVKEHNCLALSWQEILNNSDIAGVVIATPAETHATLAKEALQAGKHVYVEKPLALDVNQAKSLCQLADQVGKQLMVGHLLQYHPAFMRLKLLVDQGEIGNIQYIYSSRLNFGKMRREEDILWSFAPHDISMILSLIGKEPDQVQAVGGYYLRQTIADTTNTYMTFPSGEQAHIYVSWLHPFKEQKLIVVGNKAMAVFDDTKSWQEKLTLYHQHVEWQEDAPFPSAKELEKIPLDDSEPLRAECQHFLDCIAHNKRPKTDGYEGLRVLNVLDRAAISLQKTRQPGQVKRHLYHDVYIHDTACVDRPAVIGAGTKIWHFSHIMAHSQIGKSCVIGQNVMVGPQVKVGDRCKIQNNVSLYQGVTLEEEVFCGPSCVFTNVNTPRAHIERKEEFRPTHVGRGATIGANATIICGAKLGAYCFIGAGAVITKDVPPHALMVGNPARQVGWVSHAGEVLTDNLICPREKRQYQLDDEQQLITAELATTN